MPTIDDHSYLKACAQLASCYTISLAAARRKVELALMAQGKKGLDERKKMVEKLLKDAKDNKGDGNDQAASNLDNLLIALAEEENFMTED